MKLKEKVKWNESEMKRKRKWNGENETRENEMKGKRNEKKMKETNPCCKYEACCRTSQRRASLREKCKVHQRVLFFAIGSQHERESHVVLGPRSKPKSLLPEIWKEIEWNWLKKDWKKIEIDENWMKLNLGTATSRKFIARLSFHHQRGRNNIFSRLNQIFVRTFEKKFKKFKKIQKK